MKEIIDVMAENGVWGDIKKVLQSDRVVGDCYVHSEQDMQDLHHILFDEVKGRHVGGGVAFDTCDEAWKKVSKCVGDGFFNEANGVGSFLDPSTYTKANTPVMIGPNEASSVYSSGGLGAVIIDKKSFGLIDDGISFDAYDNKFWDKGKLQMLEEACVVTGTNQMVREHIRDALLFGGSIMYPIFAKDSKKDLMRPLDRLGVGKGEFVRWVQVDRWNTTYTPSYDITASDYLNPKSIYVPIGGQVVGRGRFMMLRPKTVPYWALMYNLGWTPSDLSGYMRSLYNYTIITMAAPIMAQQMSLLLYRMPLDSIDVTMSRKAIEQIMDINEEQMASWSISHPKAVNMIGELTVVERHFSGYDLFVGSAKTDLSAQCGIAEPVLFHTPNKGFSDNTTTALLKDSETMKTLTQTVIPQLRMVVDVMVAHVWGMDSEEWDRRSSLYLKLDRPVVSTEKDRAESGARFSATIASLTTAGVPTVTALKLARKFFDIDIDDDIVGEVTERYEEDRRLGSAGQTNGGGFMSKIGGKNVGKFAKPVKGGTTANK